MNEISFLFFSAICIALGLFSLTYLFSNSKLKRIQSDLGFPVYESMFYTTVFRIPAAIKSMKIRSSYTSPYFEAYTCRPTLQQNYKNLKTPL